MSTDSTSTFYDPVYEARKALREAGVGAPSLSERAARAPRQVMPRDEAPATPLSEAQELVRDVVGDVLSRVSLPPSPAPRQGVAGTVSPRARSEQRERGRGPAERCQTGGGHATVV